MCEVCPALVPSSPTGAQTWVIGVHQPGINTAIVQEQRQQVTVVEGVSLWDTVMMIRYISGFLERRHRYADSRMSAASLRNEVYSRPGNKMWIFA